MFVEYCIVVFKLVVFLLLCYVLLYIEILVIVLENVYQVITLKLVLLSIIFIRRKNGISLFVMFGKLFIYFVKNLIEFYLEVI